MPLVRSLHAPEIVAEWRQDNVGSVKLRFFSPLIQNHLGSDTNVDRRNRLRRNLIDNESEAGETGARSI